MPLLYREKIIILIHFLSYILSASMSSCNTCIVETSTVEYYLFCLQYLSMHTTTIDVFLFIAGCFIMLYSSFWNKTLNKNIKIYQWIHSYKLTENYDEVSQFVNRYEASEWDKLHMVIDHVYMKTSIWEHISNTCKTVS